MKVRTGMPASHTQIQFLSGGCHVKGEQVCTTDDTCVSEQKNVFGWNTFKDYGQYL